MASKNVHGPEVDKAQRVSLNFHHGQVLCRISETYPGLLAAILEIIQNAIDGEAKVVFVGIDQLKKRVAVCDNGTGISLANFTRAIGTVGKSQKTPAVRAKKTATGKSLAASTDPDAKLGQFGLGIVAPITKAETMQIISSPRGGNEGIHRWLFNAAELQMMESDLSIADMPVDEFPPLPEPFTHAANEAKLNRRGPGVKWSTMVLLDRVVRDRTISRVDVNKLALDVLLKFGDAMLLRGTTVFIKLRDLDGTVKTRRVDPTVPQGEKLDTVVLTEPDAGRVDFELYRAPRKDGKRNGRVKIAEFGTVNSVPLVELCAQVADKEWLGSSKPELVQALNALNSGYFEGWIRAENIVMHSGRKMFENTDPLEGLFKAIQEWYDKVGRTFFDEARQEHENARYKALGEESIARMLRRIQENADLSLLFRDIGSVLPGAMVKPTKRKETEERKERGTNAKRKPRVVARPPARSDGDQPSSTPLFPNFAYDVLDGTVLWDYDFRMGQLTLNIAHPLWVMLDDTRGTHTPSNNRRIQQLQEYLVMDLLTSLLMAPDPEAFAETRVMIDLRVEAFILLFLSK